MAGVTSGKLGYALKAGFIAAVTAAAFYEVGVVTGSNPAFGTAQYFEKVAASALVGCASAAASGGKCGAGALSAGVSAAAGPFIDGQNYALNVASHAVVGGLASVAGGGKFANGAVTGAFAYLSSPQAGDKRIDGAYGSLGESATSPDGATNGEQWQRDPNETDVAGWCGNLIRACGVLFSLWGQPAAGPKVPDPMPKPPVVIVIKKKPDE